MRLKKQDLLSLEDYSTQRNEFRQQVMAHKVGRRFHLGEHVVLYFESRLTMQYQVQEMLRIEKIFEADGIQQELDIYNPLIPDGNGWRATMMIEYVDAEQRKRCLAELTGIEDTLWFGTDKQGLRRFLPKVNPDLERSSTDKTSAVHFIFFDFTEAEKVEILSSTQWYFGIDHPNYGPLAVIAEGALRTELMNEIILKQEPLKGTSN